jgi:hypothetical protein
MKKLLILIAFLMFVFVGQAQEDSLISKNTFTVSVNFGVGSYIGIDAPAPTLPYHRLSAPMTAWFSKTPILDVEGRWFVTDKWALKLTGALAYSYNPAYNSGLPGSADLDETAIGIGDIPTYEAVPSSNNIQFAIGVGAEHYYATKSDRLFLRAGGEFVYAYGCVKENGDEYSLTPTGASVGEAYAFRIAPVVGLDYYFTKQLFAGIDVRPVSYQYSVYGIRPQVGLPLLASDSHSFSFVAQPMIKLGFRF